VPPPLLPLPPPEGRTGDRGEAGGMEEGGAAADGGPEGAEDSVPQQRGGIRRGWGQRTAGECLPPPGGMMEKVAHKTWRGWASGPRGPPPLPWP